MNFRNSLLSYIKTVGSLKIFQTLKVFMSFILLYDSVFDQQIPIKSLFEGIRLEYISCFQLWSVVINVVV